MHQSRDSKEETGELLSDRCGCEECRSGTNLETRKRRRESSHQIDVAVKNADLAGRALVTQPSTMMTLFISFQLAPTYTF